MSCKNKIESKTLHMNINNIKNSIKILSTEFECRNNTLDNYCYSLLCMLYHSVIQHHKDYIVTDFDKNDNRNQIKKVMNSIKQCKTVIRYLILLDSEYYMYTSNRYIHNPDTITQSKICGSITTTFYSIKQYIKFLFLLNKIESNVINNILLRFNIILRDIIKNNISKIKQFYCKHHSVLDNCIYNGNKFSNDIDKRFNNKKDLIINMIIITGLMIIILLQHHHIMIINH